MPNYFKLLLFLSFVICLFLFLYNKYDTNKNESILNLSVQQSQVKKFIENWEQVVKLRKNIVKEICKKYPKILSFTQTVNSFLFQKEANLVYCRNGKAGTSSWLRLFLNISNIPFETIELDHNRAVELFSNFPHTKKSIFFTVVRHPMTRLVSAYRDKIKEGYRLDLQNEILRKYRNSTSNLSKWKTIATTIEIDVEVHPTFGEFIEFITNEIEVCTSSTNPLLCQQDIDVHWKPFYLRCNPCTFYYDVISKIETFSEDEKYIKYKASRLLNKSNTTINFILPNKRDSSQLYNHWHKSEGIPTDELTKTLFSLLSDKQKDKILKVFLFDFLLFNYNPNEYG